MLLQPVETFGLVFITVDDYQISQRSRSTFTPAGRGTLPSCLLLTQWGKTSTGSRDWPQWNLRNEELVGRWGDEQEGDTWSLNTGQQLKSLLSGTEPEPHRGMYNHNTPCYGAVTWDILLIDHLNQECICGGNCWDEMTLFGIWSGSDFFIIQLLSIWVLLYLKENWEQITSAVREHRTKTGHSMEWERVKGHQTRFSECP